MRLRLQGQERFSYSDALRSANKQLLDKLKKQLMDRFEMTDMGNVSRVLGMNITRDREEGTITINQKDYT